ncbi:glycoside hydrolase family 13 protein [Fonticella tunisiensis]|uniref:Glycosidase n=1 Tax=Fonticella tunisiensis TaxID=1096341 RepID=A0A4R7KEK1_9CLOT|nr:glycoside hydrolase family 13 protein [Fonticella tunisiensis]TDT52001.1 glycosidase [Fonticella tunisiensis]
MLKEAIYHKSDSTYAYPLNEKRLCIKLRTKKNDLKRVTLCYGDRYEPVSPITIFEKDMDLTYRDELFDYFEIIIEPDFNRICYYFRLEDENEVLIYSQRRFYETPPMDRNRYFMFSCICKGDLYEGHKWWTQSVFYQIFVDRFNKEKIDDNWFMDPTPERIFGGNLKGIIDKLDYLEDLGVNCIYLTPIFESKSNHKYDTLDYYKIDRGFGDEETFRELVEACHSRGIRVVLDAVFNHTSSNFFAFRDAIERGKESPYFDWYFIKNRDEYKTFGYTKLMPKLNTASEGTKRYLLDIGRYWVEKYDIDGWRLDVANEIDHKFWRSFREEIKRVKSDAIIIGEVWDGAESYLQGDQFDSAMNYPFMYILLEYFAKGSIDLQKFDWEINNLFVRYRMDIRKNLLNLLDSHDTSRFLYECGNDVERLKSAVFYMMTTIGIPMIFYGDEAGISGANDPDCRRTMNFDNINYDLHSFYKKLIKIRRGSSALMEGEYRTVKVTDSLYAYRRVTEDEEVVCVFNNGDREEEFILENCGKVVSELLSEAKYICDEGRLKLSTKPGDKYIFRCQPPEN